MTDLTRTEFPHDHNAERAALVGLQHPKGSLPEAEGSLVELERLVASAGAEVVAKQLVRLRHYCAATLLTKGHVEDLALWAELNRADLVVLDGDLSPVQQRNLEEVFGRRVITRTEVILDIFATHARTRESMTQVELAQLRYHLPRLVGAPIASARMGGVGVGAAGGIAMRGPGETQLEVDRRTIRARVRKLEETLRRIESQRATQRRHRLRTGLPLVGLVGYTNAGKSTLLNRLTDAGVLVEDRLFSTLDTTVRTLALSGGLEVGLIDTVGFVSKLPPTLVAAFRATLEEATFADLILHVVDATSQQQALEFATTSEILTTLGCQAKPLLTVWNKIDRIADPVEINALTLRRTPSVAISALEGTGVAALLDEVERMIMAQGHHAILRVPYDRYDLVARIHRESQVLESRDSPEGKILRCRLAPHLVDLTAPYRLDAWPAEADPENAEAAARATE
jgi:GTP-binding protein HflX